MGLIRAAGGILWRSTAQGPQLAVVHRTRQGDWTLPKGKLEPGERWEEAALREVREETGYFAELASFATLSFYTSRRGPKLVLYWHMVAAGESAPPDVSEVDEVAWLSPSDAARRIDGRDRTVLARASLEAQSNM